MDRTPVNLDTVSATLDYLCSSERRPVTYMLAPPGGHSWETAGYCAMAVNIHNGRAAPQAPRLDREGFTLLQAPSAMHSFAERAAIERTYYAEMADLALAASGASRAIVFDHLLRRRAPGSTSPFGALDGRRPGIATRIHSDFTPVSAARRLALERDRLGIGTVARYAIVNLWRSAGLPVLDAPLAVCDARSVAPIDLVAADIVYPDRSGEIFEVLYNQAHAWTYFEAMKFDEVLMFKQFDSQEDGPRYTPHAAFAHPATPPGTPPRESIEVRCLLLYE